MMTDVAIDVQVGRLTERVDNLEDRFDRHEKVQNDSIQTIQQDIRKMRDDVQKLVAGRPSWAVAIAFTILSNITVGLIIYEATH